MYPEEASGWYGRFTIAEKNGIKSFENLRSDAVEVEFEGYTLKVASLEKIIRSKRIPGGGSCL